eukprot:590778-Amphidinium_carterae.1
MSVICWGTLFHVAALLKDKSARSVRQAYRKGWVQVFGPPRKLVCDQGKEFVSVDFASRCESDGTLQEMIP